MALTRFNYQPGQYETCIDETLVPASPVLNTWYNFEIGDWKHAISDVVLKQAGSPIPESAYELAIDTKYTAREAGESAKTVYAKWRIVNATYDEIVTTVTGNNFGTYIDNAKTDSRLDALEAFDAALDAAAVPYGNSASGLTATDTQAAIDEIQGDASKIDYDNAQSGLAATDVKGAIDEVSVADGVAYDNGTSGLAATDVQAALDEIDAVVDTIVLPTKGVEVAAYSYTKNAPFAGYFKIEDPSMVITTGQQAIVKFTLASGAQTAAAYFNFSISGEDGAYTNMSRILQTNNNTKSTQLILPVGRYAVFVNFSPAGINHTITVVYKMIDTGLSYT